MDRKVTSYVIKNLGDCYKLPIIEHNGYWLYQGEYTSLLISDKLNENRTDWERGETWYKIQVSASITRMGETSPLGLAKASDEMQKVASVAAELENMGIEFCEKRKGIA